MCFGGASVANAWCQAWHRREPGIEDATAGLVHWGGGVVGRCAPLPAASQLGHSSDRGRLVHTDSTQATLEPLNPSTPPRHHKDRSWCAPRRKPSKLNGGLGVFPIAETRQHERRRVLGGAWRQPKDSKRVDESGEGTGIYYVCSPLSGFKRGSNCSLAVSIFHAVAP